MSMCICRTGILSMINGRILEERKNEYPKPRDVDKKLKETIAPCRWLSERGRYTLSLEAGLLNNDSFEEYNMLGNGYDWETVVCAFLEDNMAQLEGQFAFYCEADTFSMQSKTKKPLKEFAFAFREFLKDTDRFEELLSQLKNEN